MKRNMKGLIAGSVALTALATGLIRPWEGRELRAYYDIVNVLTICDGDTHNVSPGMVETHEGCDMRLANHLKTYEAELDRCLTGYVSGVTKVALLSWAYNVGVPAACGSTLVRLVNSGNVRAACDQLPRWNRAGGQVVRGLTNRREAERKMCIEGVGQ